MFNIGDKVRVKDNVIGPQAGKEGIVRTFDYSGVVVNFDGNNVYFVPSELTLINMPTAYDSVIKTKTGAIYFKTREGWVSRYNMFCLSDDRMKEDYESTIYSA